MYLREGKNMNNAYIFYGRYYDFEKKNVTIGGIQTYIANLCELCAELGMAPCVVQKGTSDEEIELDFYRVVQYAAGDLKTWEETVEKKLLPQTDREKDLFIFATDTIIFSKLQFPRSIAIQHGIFWDIPKKSNRSLFRVLLSKGKRAYRNIRALQRVGRVVCVDYNFVNWYRTQVETPADNFSVVPNFAPILPPAEKPEGPVRLIFARRLFSYRGTHIFTEAVQRLLDEGTNIHVTIAGTGEDEAWMRGRLDAYENVEFTVYESADSLKIHQNQHVAVVPTVGSEGTSLSLLEAMSAGCAPICTNVGGMTNIVIDGYNGLMVSPNADALYQAMKSLVEDGALRLRLAEKARETVCLGFSYDKWKDEWLKILRGAMA